MKSLLAYTSLPLPNAIMTLTSQILRSNGVPTCLLTTLPTTIKHNQTCLYLKERTTYMAPTTTRKKSKKQSKKKNKNKKKSKKKSKKKKKKKKSKKKNKKKT